jgi:putative membrane protein
VGVTTRQPRWVYDEGDEPDPRFSLANERTFLSWIQVSLALLAGGVALEALGLSFSGDARKVVSVLLVLLALAAAVIGWVRWARTERAVRLATPLPGSVLLGVVVTGVVVVAVVLLFLVVRSR